MKNRIIELERFVAACIIVLYHLNKIKAGWIFVEFFFILTGFFLMNHLVLHKEAIDRDEAWYPLKYTFQKYKSIFPYTTLSIIILWLYLAEVWQLSGTAIIKWLLYLPCDLLLIGGSGMLPYGLVFHGTLSTPRMINVLLWYVSSMLIVMPIAFALLRNEKRRGLLCTIVPAILYGFLIMRDGRVNGWHDEKFGFVYCNIRALAGLLMGAGTWHLAEWWKRREYTRFGKSLLTAIELLTFIIFAGIANTTLPYDCLEIALIVVSVSLTASGVTYTSFVKCNLFNLLGSWSLAIYCLHKPIMNICMRWFCEDNAYLILAISIAASAIYTYLINLITNRKKNKGSIVEKLVVKTTES